MAETVHGKNVTRLRTFAEPGYGLGIILLDAGAVPQHACNAVHCVCIAALGRLAVQPRGFACVPLDDLSAVEPIGERDHRRHTAAVGAAFQKPLQIFRALAHARDFDINLLPRAVAGDDPHYVLRRSHALSINTKQNVTELKFRRFCGSAVNHLGNKGPG